MNVRHALVISLFAFSPSSFACEKWKTEIGKLSWHLGSYLKTYHAYETRRDDVMHHQLMNKSREISEKLTNLRGYTVSTESCEHPDGKFEARRRLILSTLKIALPTITAAKYLAPAIKEKIDHDKD